VELTLLDIVIIAGPSASGKSSIAKKFIMYGYEIIECGDIVRSQMIQCGWQKSTSEFHTYMKNKQGKTYLLSSIMGELNKKTNKNKTKIIIVGLRTFELFEILNSTLNIKCSIFIDSDIKNRYQRYIQHQKKRLGETVISLNGFKEQEKIHNSWGLDKIKKFCSFIVLNNKSIDDIITSILIKFNMPYEPKF